jgi:glycosyltransferase involved in cell wall biosynthesis
MPDEKSIVSVSCVIPTHLRAQFLVESLGSAARQTLPPAEIIVVSDVDDPETAAVCKRFAAQSEIPLRVEVNTTGPGGASSSRNRGAQLASGEMLAFLDDDDTWEPTFLEKSVAVLEQSGSGIAVAWISMFTNDKVKLGPAIVAGLSAPDVVAINPGVTGTNMVVRRSAFESIGGFDDALRMKNDTDFFYRFLKSGGRYAVVEERLANQRKHDAGQLTGHSLARAVHTEAYMRKHQSDLRRGDVKHMKFVIHRIKSHAAATRRQRLAHKLGAALNYTYKQYVQDRRNRRDRQFFDVPSSSRPGDHG